MRRPSPRHRAKDPTTTEPEKGDGVKKQTQSKRLLAPRHAELIKSTHAPIQLQPAVLNLNRDW